MLPQITLDDLNRTYAQADQRLQWISDRTKDLLFAKSSWFRNLAAGRAYLSLGWMYERKELRDTICEFVEQELVRRGIAV